MKAHCAYSVESGMERTKSDLETRVNWLIQARDNSGMQLDGDSGDGEKMEILEMERLAKYLSARIQLEIEQ